MSIAAKCTCGHSLSGICLDRIKECNNILRTKDEKTLEEPAEKWSLQKAQEFALNKFKQKNTTKKGIVTLELVLEVLKVGVLTGHKFGAKWQQERSYSDEEVNEIIAEVWNSCEDNEGETFTEVRKRILEQFKKK